MEVNENKLQVRNRAIGMLLAGSTQKQPWRYRNGSQMVVDRHLRTVVGYFGPKNTARICLVNSTAKFFASVGRWNTRKS